MKKSLLLNLLLFASFIAYSQQVLDGNDVGARINNNGILFYNSGPQIAGYEVPRNSGRHSIFATSLWCSGQDANGQLHLAGMRFGQSGNDYFPGPFSSTNAYTASTYAAEYGTSIWQVYKSEVLNHIANYTSSSYIMPTSISSWPGNGISGAGIAQNLAPFIDLNNNGIYEPILGEYPDIRGDVAVYTIMNDDGAPHTETGGEKMGIEVHTMAYQFVTNDYHNRTTYLHYRVFNRGSIAYQNFKIGLWWDPDLGNASDDFVGCDTLTNMMYAYNADNMDETSTGATLGYGANPPAAGITSLTRKMKNFAYFTNSGVYPYSDPSSAPQYYNFMNGLWADGSTMVYGGTGAAGSSGSTTTPSNYLLPGNPNNISEWSELSIDGMGLSNQPGDRRGVMTLEAENLPSGDYSCYDFAVLYARDPGNNNLQNVNSLITLAATAKTDFDSMTDYNCNIYTLRLEKLDESKIGVYPNPNNGEFTLSFGEQLSGELQITDMTGRLVLTERFDNQTSMGVGLSEKSGIYHLTIQTENGTVHKKISIQD